MVIEKLSTKLVAGHCIGYLLILFIIKGGN